MGCANAKAVAGPPSRTLLLTVYCARGTREDVWEVEVPESALLTQTSELPASTYARPEVPESTLRTTEMTRRQPSHCQ